VLGRREKFAPIVEWMSALGAPPTILLLYIGHALEGGGWGMKGYIPISDIILPGVSTSL